MVKLNKIYTRTGDDGTTGLAAGGRRPKHDLRVEAYGAVDETNAAVGLARLHAGPELDAVLSRIQNELFDLGADLATPDTGQDLGYEPLRIVASQVERLEADIDAANAALAPLKSFVLPAGAALSAHLHMARTIARRAERLMTALAAREPVSRPALSYVNRLSDYLFVAARAANAEVGDVLWAPGKTR
ncbi:cob(I)yrinic acid a,c-diamide adenosyltransferase [Methylopila jiangsuensis]|uniref:Corrinoid adenosyltransferase n=1 Tax=Methylopila jiangsuensis TaxID=586230 RepID=A0A9W6JJH0_9HYPH|nr:cob(I)yrinic acid a,c-diamide adenosyltransferase [Methylopila jiangsuensis]MDR6286977.1 cob(I)alamin adenosyltransferase [Methylopila jiangsuensis]GLK76673.1 cob(I)yrinic acid a,c-diamide adenosyltransferase [Methylopila jiangsuensis]